MPTHLGIVTLMVTTPLTIASLTGVITIHSGKADSPAESATDSAPAVFTRNGAVAAPMLRATLAATTGTSLFFERTFLSSIEVRCSHESALPESALIGT